MGKSLHRLLLASAACIGAALAALSAQGDTTRAVLDSEYNLIGYNEKATRNPVAQLADRLESGEVELEWREERGYLDSLLEALNISPASQVLVFSPTSLQYRLISPETPRALFFNDETYIGFVQKSTIVEIATMDAEKGLVFYVFNNSRQAREQFERASQGCLVCHDSQGAMGGGVPIHMALSSIYTESNRNIKSVSGPDMVTDRTPLADRWGGWYVSGWNGSQPHLGNIRLPDPGDLSQLDEAMKGNGNLVTLEGAGLLDVSPYPRPTSDMVALLVLEHQLTVQNELTYVLFKAPAVLSRLGLSEAGDVATWDALPERARDVLARMLDDLVDAMLFVDAAEYEDRIAGLREYEDWFQAQGPKDGQGRSLRDLDLGRGLLEHPLSYLIHSDTFDGLPSFARDYVFARLADILEGRVDGEDYAHLSTQDRRAILEILMDTKPEFRAYANGARSVSQG